MCSLPPSPPTFQERWVQHQGDVGVAESGVATPHSEPSVHQAAKRYQRWKLTKFLSSLTESLLGFRKKPEPRAEIKLPPGAGAQNYELRVRLLSIYRRLGRNVIE
jgi:hypothetical protein